MSPRLAPLASVPSGQLLIHEIYHSIQGESTFAGLPCVFVRLAVCNLRCVWCDTPHAFREGRPMSREEIRAQVRGYQCPLVEITGGEPLLQPEVHPLMSVLADDGYTVLLETSGAEDIAPVDPRVHIIMDLKCPDSGESAANRWENLDRLKPRDEIKFVIASRRDCDWAIDVIRQHHLDRRFSVLLSPAFGRVNPRDLAEWLLASGVAARLHLQLHKHIWPPDMRGV
jgi:7-carboxy-7-deazaguanine synthase